MKTRKRNEKQQKGRKTGKRHVILKEKLKQKK